jgi:hypothetical protein
VDAVDRSELELLRVQVSSKLDRLTDAVNNNVAVQRDFAADHEKRVRSLERWKYAIPASTLLVLAAFLGGKAA